MEYLDAGGPVVNSSNAGKRITTLGINLDLNSYIENIKNKTLQTLKSFHISSKEYYKHNN